MSSELKLQANTGRTLGSRSSRRLRHENKIPAVIYGHGSDPIPVTLDRLEFRSALNAAGANAVINNYARSSVDISHNAQCFDLIRYL